MPNYCSNHLVVTGNPADVKEFLEKANSDYIYPWNGKIVKEQSALNFYALIPPPENLNLSDNEIYDFYIDEFGCKWVNFDASLDCCDGYAAYDFVSPWCPPLKAIETISELFPKLKFSGYYYEGGERFAGTFTAQNGTLEDEYVEGFADYLFKLREIDNDEYYCVIDCNINDGNNNSIQEYLDWVKENHPNEYDNVINEYNEFLVESNQNE
jgi:hypothetical protein